MSGSQTGEDELTLALEASTYRGSVALFRGATVAAESEVAMRGATEERLMPAAAAALAAVGAEAGDLVRLVCGAGPGSFTSLRIAAAIAKGLAMARGTPLYAVSSLLLVAAGGETPLDTGSYLVVTDAMREERFSAQVQVDSVGVPTMVGDVRRLASADVAQWAAERGLQRIGPGELMERWPHARGAGLLMTTLLASGPVNLSTWEPTYGRLAEAQVKWEAAHGRALHAD